MIWSTSDFEILLFTMWSVFLNWFYLSYENLGTCTQGLTIWKSAMNGFENFLARYIKCKQNNTLHHEPDLCITQYIFNSYLVFCATASSFLANSKSFTIPLSATAPSVFAPLVSSSLRRFLTSIGWLNLYNDGDKNYENCRDNLHGLDIYRDYFIKKRIETF